jgi:hypothetical protein
MLKRLNANIIIALCTSGAMIGFALYQRYASAGTVPEFALCVAAAVICLLTVLYG